MSLDPTPEEFEAEAPPPRLDRATALVRVYTRAFLGQGAGLVGLAWCLAQNLPWVAFGLTVLVLIDQAIFLRGRPALEDAPWLQTGLDGWCLAVSCADLVLLFAGVFRALGLREVGGSPVSGPMDCLAFALATLLRLDVGLAPVASDGRLLAAGEALLGDLILLGILAAIVRITIWGPFGADRR